MAASWAGLVGEIDPRISFLLAAAPSVGSALWIWWQWRARREDERDDREMSREDRRTRELDAQQSTFDAEKARWFGDLRQENRDLRLELAETRRDRDQGWNLARWWHGAAHDVLRAYRNCRHNALNMQQWINAAVQRHGIPMPDAIEPVPDRIDLPMGLEEPK